MQLALPTAIAAVYEAVCPSHVASPQSAIAGIKQTYTTDENTTVTIPVQEYYNNYIAAGAPLFQGNATDIDVFTPFIDGLNDDLRRVVEQRNPYRGQVVPRNTRVVMRRLREVLAIASNGQEEITNQAQLISNVMGGTGPTFTGIPVQTQAAVPALPAPSQIIPPPSQVPQALQQWASKAIQQQPQCPPVPAPAYPSQAERTLQQHEGKVRTNFCWGCSLLFPYIANHLWFDNIRKRVICPNEHVEGAKKAAAAERTRFIQQRHERNPQTALLSAVTQLAPLLQQLASSQDIDTQPRKKQRQNDPSSKGPRIM